ncbi:MAG: PIN domain-containing protein [Chitinophagales bacterium]|nr:PIN domain-containing protein [Chitinophagales bacterium]
MTAAKSFVDSNIFIYLLSDDSVKRNMEQQLLLATHLISTQLIAESVNFCLKKLKLSKEEAFAFGDKLLKSNEVRIINASTLELAFGISLKYNLSWWDSLIAAAALEGGCTTLYSEDMQHQQIIEGHLTITNPFK